MTDITWEGGSEDARFDEWVTDIKPALTKEKLERGVDLACSLVYARLDSDPRYISGDIEAVDEKPPYLVLDWRAASDEYAVVDRHALAALCLHDQEYGFTWDMVDQLTSMADWYAEQVESHVVRAISDPLTSTNLREIAHRISALLPPRE